MLAVALIACGPSIGWWTLVPLLAAAVVFRLSEHGLEEAGQPEFRLAGAWVFAQLMIARASC